MLGSREIAQIACISGVVLIRMSGVILAATFPLTLSARSAAPLPEITLPEGCNAENSQYHKYAYQYLLDHLHALGRAAPFKICDYRRKWRRHRWTTFQIRFGLLTLPGSKTASIPPDLSEHRQIRLSSQVWYQQGSANPVQEQLLAAQC